MSALDKAIKSGYSDWVNDAPRSWKTDGFLSNNSPIIITSRYGQNARIAVPGHEDEEAAAWDKERNYSRIAYFTLALATSIEYAPPPSLLLILPFDPIGALW